MPAAVLIVIVLGAIAVDAAIVYLGERRAADLSASIANNAAALVDDVGYYQQDRICLPQDALQEYARQRFVTASDARFAVVVDVEADSDAPVPSGLAVVDSCLDVGVEPTVEARVVARVPLIFSRALPGRDQIVVDATTRVRLVAR